MHLIIMVNLLLQVPFGPLDFDILGILPVRFFLWKFENVLFFSEHQVKPFYGEGFQHVQYLFVLGRSNRDGFDSFLLFWGADRSWLSFWVHHFTFGLVVELLVFLLFLFFLLKLVLCLCIVLDLLFDSI